MNYCAKMIQCLRILVITKHWEASFVFHFIWKFPRSADYWFLKFISVRYRGVPQVYRSCILKCDWLWDWSLFLAHSRWCSRSWFTGFIHNLCLATECLAQIIWHIWNFNLLLIHMIESFHSWMKWPNRLLMVCEHDIVQIQFQTSLFICLTTRLWTDRRSLYLLFQASLRKSILSCLKYSVVACSTTIAFWLCLFWILRSSSHRCRLRFCTDL